MTTNKGKRVFGPLPDHRTHDQEAEYIGSSSRELHRLCERGIGPPRFKFLSRWHYPNAKTEEYILSLSEAAE